MTQRRGDQDHCNHDLCGGAANRNYTGLWSHLTRALKIENIIFDRHHNFMLCPDK
jgi:hypothetical protein